MVIPKTTIDKIRAEADIVQIIGEYIKLEKKGNNYLGLCPFHQDNNPSLTVSPTKKIYTCFSCGAKGNVFTFLENYKNISFLEAVKYAGNKSGIDLKINKYPNLSQDYEKYYKILQIATSFYEFYIKNSTDGKEALKYLHKRKLNDEIIKRFRIGLAPKENDLLYQSLSEKKYQPLDMIEAGVIRSYKDSYFDTFRNRIVFPLEDINGNIVGFSGRVYNSKQSNEPKYLNSSENKIFKKSTLLYNFHRNINNIRLKDEVYVFEGFLDVIAAYQIGIDNAVATMGTALTDEQIKAINKVTKNVILCYDGDEAGLSASKKAIRLFTRAGLNIRAVLIPEELDPDDYLKKYGEEKLHKLLSEPISGIDFLYEISKMKLNLEDINSIESFKTAVFESISDYRSNVLSEKFLNRMADDLEVSFESLQADYKVSAIAPVVRRPVAAPKIKRVKPVKKKYLNSERQLVKIAYYNRDDCIKIIDALDIFYVDCNNYNILQKIGEYYKTNEDTNLEDINFSSKFEENEKNILKEIIETKTSFDDQPIDVLVKNVKDSHYEELYAKQTIECKKNPTDENYKKLASLKNRLINHKE